MDIKKLELEILIELEFSLQYPSALEFLMIYSSLLQPESKIRDEKTAQKFDKFQTKMSIYIAQNASFLNYNAAQTAAACLLLTMKLTGLLELYET